MSPVPKEELPDVAAVRAIAIEHLPSYYALVDVRCSRDSAAGLLPLDWEIAIEYSSWLDPRLEGTLDEIGTMQSWVQRIEDRVRSEWPAHTVRIRVSQSTTS
jgi:hypothetical protein